RVKLPAALAWAAVLCVVLFAQTWVRAERPNGIDLTSYLLSARALLHGDSPYLLPTPFPYLYPATLAFLLIPLTFVPAAVAVVVDRDQVAAAGARAVLHAPAKFGMAAGERCADRRMVSDSLRPRRNANHRHLPTVLACVCRDEPGGRSAAARLQSRRDDRISD